MTSVASKTCTKCGASFDAVRSGHQCPDCRRAYNREYYKNGLGVIKAAEAAERASNPPALVTEKACTRCLTVQPLEMFQAETRRATGRGPVCKACRRAAYRANPEPVIAQVKAHYMKNAARIRAKKKARREADPLAAKRAQAASYQRNREKRMIDAAVKRATPEYAAEAAARTQAWREADPERYLLSAKRYRDLNPEKRKATIRAWMDANPEKVKASRMRRSGHERNAFTLPFTAEQLRARMDYFGRVCWMCGGAFEHIDHVKPLSKMGANILANYRPSCASCNMSKKDKWYGVSGLHRFIKN